jgi:hypothetical protein
VLSNAEGRISSVAPAAPVFVKVALGATAAVAAKGRDFEIAAAGGREAVAGGNAENRTAVSRMPFDGRTGSEWERAREFCQLDEVRRELAITQTLLKKSAEFFI